MLSAVRKFGFLPYSEHGELEQIIQLVNDDIPVIVFQNLSIAWLPQWHYAVVIGYDFATSELVLHTGVTPNHRMSFALFEKTWHRGDYWFLAPVNVEQKSEAMNSFTCTSKAMEIIDEAQAAFPSEQSLIRTRNSIRGLKNASHAKTQANDFCH